MLPSARASAKRKSAGHSGADASIAARLLEWYDVHRRNLPWRAPPGATADPYGVWLSEIMLQQTTVPAVKGYYAKFLDLWPDMAALAAAPLDDVLKAWAGLGYYSRARNLHACARLVARHYGGQLPREEAALRRLPGVGPYTAAAISAIAFGRRAVVVDANVERVIARLFAIDLPLPKAKGDIRARADALTPAVRAGDFAQAMMDLGATVCSPKRPACVICPLQSDCQASAGGQADRFPVKPARSERPRRMGAVFVLRRADCRLLLRRRPPKGLLGGMSEFPGSAWLEDFDMATALAHAPAPVRWKQLPGEVEHVFTHFALRLAVFLGEVPKGARAPRGGRFVDENAVDREALPTLMRKVLALARPHFRQD